MSDNEVIEFYKDHSGKQTREKFGVSHYILRSILSRNGVQRHTQSFENRMNGNGYARKKNKEFLDYVSSLNVEEFKEYYKNHAKKATEEHFGLTRWEVDKLLNYLEIDRLSAIEAKKVIYTDKFGSFEEGLRIEREKMNKDIDYEKANEKRRKTCLSRYGVDSAFRYGPIKEKAKRTILEKYGVDNVSKLDWVVEKIRNSHIEHHGGIGWASDSLMEEYKTSMRNRYGVEYACMLPQCYNAKHGSNSQPNLRFIKLCDKNSINIDEREFIIGNFRYDFRIGNTLVEIDPSYTHNSTVKYKGIGRQMNPSYHANKTQNAVNSGYRCMHVFDWDDLSKIANILKPKQTLFARKCVVREIDESVSLPFIEMVHLQGYSKSSIHIGLFYDDVLVSVMTFGKPKNNKNYQYELIRYCYTANIIGGPEKLFRYFVKNYSPKSIISYCDLSKFSGEMYKRLGFSELRKTKPLKHWYSVREKRHITDNLLKKKGCNRLFGESFEKDIPNDTMMINRGYVEVYDCGQQSYTWKNKSLY
ncbi:MAG: hypothetical protein J6S67_19915 [Methanobrevibacter sp.]|nr:hypothetical protein [Methanobrevibacter sp.]